jgi:putative glutamine amidotransferase
MIRYFEMGGSNYLNIQEGNMGYSRPRIGITMRIELETDRFYLSRHYSEGVEAAGGAPLHISLIPQAEYVQSAVRELDGILLPGSDSDVDPLRYGREPHPALGRVHPIKDQTDLLVIETAERLGMPIFAICFGMQVLNVSRGGTLVQDIAAQIEGAIKHEQGAPRDRASHRVNFLGTSLLSKLTKDETALVNSHHHQAIETVGRDLIATAWASDGLVEAVEDTRPERFVVGVQWHPELGWQHDEFSQSLFKEFIGRAERYADSTRESKTSTLAHA